MSDDGNGRKQRRIRDDGDDETKRAGTKLRRILSPEEEERRARREAKEQKLAAEAEAMLERHREERRAAKTKAGALARQAAKGESEGGADDEDWEDVSSSSGDEEDEEDGVVIPYADDDEDGEVIDAADEEDDEEDGGDDEEYQQLRREADAEGVSNALKRVTFAEGNDEEADEKEDDAPNEPKVWRGDFELDGAQGGDASSSSAAPVKLDYSNRAYDSFFQLRTEYPCLSFDVITDQEGSQRTKYPLTMYLVCGSQASENAKNQLYILKITNICRTKHDVESDDDSEEDEYIGDAEDSEEEDDAEEANGGEPMVDFRTIRHHGTANRVRCCPTSAASSSSKQFCAVWSDAGHVQVFSLQPDYSALADFANWAKEQARAPAKAGKDKTASTALKFCSPSSSHKTEGYGLDWSTVQPHVFASGDCSGDLYVWKPTEDGRWASAASSTGGKNRNSIEEIRWSPVQADVLITGRAGGMVEVWDTRDMRKAQLSWRADEQDINVCDWNRARQASHLLVTGADSGIVAVWDLRRAKDTTVLPIQTLRWHKKRITSVEFSQLNESVLAVTADDGQCTLWDLSLERDPNEEREVVGELFERRDLTQLPDQLMFQHQGLEYPKEVHWHNQVPGTVITTDFNGLHLFKPMNWRSLMK